MNAKRLVLAACCLTLAPLASAQNLVHNPSFETNAGASAEGVFSADIYVPALDNALNKRFVEAFQAKHGRVPEKIEVLGFETVWVAAKAMDKAGSDTDTAAIAEAIRSTEWETPRGVVAFDAEGQASSGDLIRLEVKDGKIAVSAD